MLSTIDHGAVVPCPAPFNLAAHVLARGQMLPDKIALQILRANGAERWSHARFAAAVRGLGTGLLRQGLAPGDRVLLRLGNTVEFPLAYLACIAVGLIPVPVSAQLTRPEVAQIIADLAPRLILAAHDLALPETPPCPVLPAAHLAGLFVCPPCAFAMGDPDRLAYMIFTSGTSGRPRAVMHAHRAIWARQMMHRGWLGLTEADRLLHFGAFNWTYTLGVGLLDPLTIGATALIPSPGVTPAQLPLLLKRFDVTIFSAAPGVYRQMLRNPVPLLPHLRHGVSAGEPMPVALRADWQAATGTAVHEAFGLSECSTFVSAAPTAPAPSGSMGHAQPGRRIAVIGDDGGIVPRGAPGILAVHRSDPGLYLGYWQAEAETRARLSGEWFLTGDMVRMAADGALTYLGRADDMMNAGGFRVSPIEVETAMRQHPAVQDCAATEVRIRADASVIACFYTASEPVEEAALVAHAADTLARYKQPRLFIRMDALPRNANNKLMRRVLRQNWETAHGPT